jgi:Tol biopolymer transport system component
MRLSTRPSKMGAAAAAAGIAILGVAVPAQAVVSGGNGRVFFGGATSAPGFNGCNCNIFKVNPDGSDQKLLTNQPDGSNGAQRPSVSGDGSKVAFQQFDDTPPKFNRAQIWIMNGDGTGKTQLTNTGNQIENRDPGISPDGTKIVFEREDETSTSPPGGTLGLFSMDSNGANEVPLTSTGLDVAYNSPEFSPDGTKIVYVRVDPGGTNQIWEMDANGNNQHVLYDDAGNNDTGPSFSPDGGQIVFSHNGNLSVMNSDGSSPAQILDSNTHTIPALNPTWSPDGTTLAFSGYAPPNYNQGFTFGIYLVSAAGGSDPTALATGSLQEYPTWAKVVAPDTFIDSGPSGVTNDPTPSFTFHSDDSSATFQCKVDGGTFNSCTSPKTLVHLADGTHTLRVRAHNSAGFDPTPAVRTFTVDTASISESSATLTITAASGAKDNLVVTRPSVSTIRVTDSASGAYTGSGVHVGAGCTRVGDYRADCHASGITLIQASSGDQTDKITNSADLASLENGGPAADVLTGGTAHDVINGGPAPDVMRGMKVNDSIEGHDLTDDTSINCDGGTSSGLNDSADLDSLPKDDPATQCENVTRH